MPYRRAYRSSVKRARRASGRRYMRAAARRRPVYRRSRRPSMRRPRGFVRMQTTGRFSATDFPNVLLKKFTWNGTFDVTPTNTIGMNFSDGFRIRLTSLYDPNYAIGTGQWSAQHYATFVNPLLYQEYMVMGAKVTLEFVNPGIYMVSNYVGLGDDGDINDLTDGMDQAQLDVAAMQPNVRPPIYAGPAEGGNNVKKISFYVDIPKAQGLTRQQYMADPTHFAGGIGTNPASNFYLLVQGISAFPNTGTYEKVNVNVVFYTRLFNNSADPAITEPVDPESLDVEMETLEKGSEVFSGKSEATVGADPIVPGSPK